MSGLLRNALLVLLAGCSSKSSPPPMTVQPLQARIVTSDDPNDYTRAATYSLSATASLYVRVEEPSLPVTTMLTLKFTDPRGTLFDEEHTPYTTSTTPTMMQDGLMHQPMQAWAADKIDGGYALVRSVPIRGTNFSRIPRGEGVWGLTADVDGVPGELSTSVTFQP